MTPVQQLAATPPMTIRLDSAVVLDWYDGPRSGFMRIAGIDSTWYFEVVAELPSGDAPDDRIYVLWSAPTDAIDRLSRAFPDESVTSPLWVPAWHASGEEIRERADAVLADIMSDVGRAEVALRSTDLRNFDAVWLVTRPIPHG